MKRSLPKSHACPTFLVGIFIFIAISAFPANGDGTATGRGSTSAGKLRRNQNKNSTQIPSPEISMVSVDEGKTVYISCPLNSTNVHGCEWFKRSPQGGNRKRITQFFDRYQRITSCQLQIRLVTYEDAGMILCKPLTDSSEPVFHTTQLIVTGEDDPFGNTLLKPSSSDNWKGSVAYAEPEIVKDLDPIYKINKGGNIVIKCEATGQPKPMVSWRRGSQVYSHATEGYSNLILKNFTKDDSGVYKCEAVNLFGKSVQQIDLQVIGALRGSSEILDVTPKNITLYERNYGNVTCIARFEGDPWFVWVKKIEDKAGVNNSFSYEGQDYAVLPRTEIRTLGQHLFATTLLLQNVTTFHSGTYHCIVAGLQGYNHSEAYVIVEKDPSKLHDDQVRRHKAVVIVCIISFVIFAALVILSILKVYGCPSTSRGKLSSQGSLSSPSSTKKTQLPKRSPETLSTDVPRHETLDPLVAHGSCSLASQEPSVHFNNCTSSCGTYNSYDHEFSAVNNSMAGGDSFLDLEAARSSYSRAGSFCDSEFCSKQSATSPRTQLSDYYARRQSQRNYSNSHRPYQHHRHPPLHHFYHPVKTTSNENNQTSNLRPYEAANLCSSCTQRPDYCSCNSYEPSNLSSLSSDCGSQWHSHQSDGISLPHHNYHHPSHLPNDEEEVYDDDMDVVGVDLDRSDRYYSYNRADARRKLNPSPNLSFLEQLRANPNTVTAIL